MTATAEELERAAVETPRAALPEFLATLARAHAIALSRIVAPEPTAPATKPADEPDVMLTHADVAAAICETDDWVHRNWRKLPFAVQKSPHKIVFSRNGMRRWLASRVVRRPKAAPAAG